MTTAAGLHFEDVRARFLAPVEARMAALLAGDALPDVAARYHLATGGKRLRALIPIWACVNLGGAAEDALDLGAGIELLHNATLVHDDLQDGDRRRRGADAVWVRWGMPQAINVGNALFFKGLQAIARAPRGPGLYDAVHEAMLAVIGGQALEFQLQTPPDAADHLPATLDAWTRMARGKTAALFALATRAGAFAAGLPPADSDRAARFGEAVGLLFQVQDDLLDIVGDKGRGQAATDLAEGKRSFPVVWAYEHATPSVAARLRRIVEAPREATTAEMVAEGVELLEACGAVAATVRWVVDAAAAAASEPVAAALPGLVDRILEPVRHVL